MRAASADDDHRHHSIVMPANRGTGWDGARLSADKRTADGNDSEEAISEQLRAVHLPSRRSNGVEPRVVGVAAALADRADELVDPSAEGTMREGRQSGLAVVVPNDRRLRVHAANDPARYWPRRRLNVEAFRARHALSGWEATIGQRGMQHAPNAVALGKLPTQSHRTAAR
jgi:hypothetical protein